MIILVLDDDDDLRETMVDILRERNHTVLDVGRGKEAIEIAKQWPGIQLVLSDVGLPDLDGWIVAKQIRECLPHARIHMITGYSQRKNNPYRSCVDGVHMKPVSFDQLFRFVEEAETSAQADVRGQ